MPIVDVPADPSRRVNKFPWESPLLYMIVYPGLRCELTEFY